MAGSDTFMNFAKKLSPAVYYRETIFIVRRTTLKMLRRKSKTQFLKQEHYMQKAIALLNYCATTINAKNASFHKIFLKSKERNHNFIK
jgi:hypothetical protein